MNNQDLLQSLVPAATPPHPTLAEQGAIQLLAALDSPDTPHPEQIKIAERLLDYSTVAAARVNARERLRQRTREQSRANDGVRFLLKSSEVAALVNPVRDGIRLRACDARQPTQN